MASDQHVRNSSETIGIPRKSANFAQSSEGSQTVQSSWKTGISICFGDKLHLIKKSPLFNEGDTSQSVMTDKPVALRIRIELEFGNVCL